MSQTAHTPAPWFVGNADVEACRWDIYSPYPNGGGADIAHVIYDTAAAPTEAEGLANARLIAAAPELLDALSDMYAWLGGSARTPTEREAVEKARAVLAKADSDAKVGSPRA